MPIESYKLGPGTLTFGTTPTDFSCQVTAATINPSENVEEEDAIPVLCGEELTGEDNVTHTFTISGTLLQDLAADGIVDYTWQNMGQNVPFVFVPSTSAARQVTGTCRIVPLSIGGEVKQRATSDFEFAIIGTPTFGAVV